MKKVLLLAVICLVLIVFFFWYVLRNKSQDVSKDEPYSSILNKEFTTQTAVIIIGNSSLPAVKEDYPKEIAYPDEIDTSSVKHLELPIGSVVTFAKAIHYAGGVSGNENAILFGKVKPKNSNNEYSVIYLYGTFKTMCIDKPCNYWEYKKEFWKQ
jgi:hypothetical protein